MQVQNIHVDLANKYSGLVYFLGVKKKAQPFLCHLLIPEINNVINMKKG